MGIFIPQAMGQLDLHMRMPHVKQREYWRVSLVATLGTFVAFFVWHILYPHTLWFYRLWGALGTGGVLGNLLGLVWQLSDASRRRRSSGRYVALLVIGGCCYILPLSLCSLAPMLGAQESELSRIRALQPTDVVAISIRVSGRPALSVTDRSLLTSFTENCRDSELFYPSHERFACEYQLDLHFMDGSIETYDVGIPERHQADMALSFWTPGGYSRVLIRNGAKWLLDVCQAWNSEAEEKESGQVPATLHD